MRSAASIETSEARGLATRMANHFGHKVAVERRGDVVHVEIGAGTFELEPADDRLQVRAEAADESSLSRVEDVVGSHLARFAREGPVEPTWRRA